MDYIGPIAGSPLIPKGFILLYISAFVAFVFIVYLIVHYKKRTLSLLHRLLIVLFTATSIKILLILIFTIVGYYVFIPPPKVVSTIPSPNSQSANLKNKIEIEFDRPLERKSLQKFIYPEIPGMWVFENPLYATHLYRKLVFYPKITFQPKTVYRVTLTHLKNFLQLSPPQSFTFQFQTQDTATIQKVETDNAIIRVYLNQPTDNVSEYNFETDPYTPLLVSYDTLTSSYTIIPENSRYFPNSYFLEANKTNITKDLTNNNIVARSKLQKIYAKKFTSNVINPQVLGIETDNNQVKVVGSFPENGWTAVASDNAIRVRFNQEVDHESAQQKFSIDPKIDGSFLWEGTTIIFQPQDNFAFNTRYTFSMMKDVTSAVGGPASIDNFTASFTTQESTTKLTVPIFLQQHALSCEAAALRMVLGFRGVDVSEDVLLDKIGSDPTPHRGKTWGNPYVNFVGNVNGKQMVSGYGVYWEPIKRVAQNYRAADSFENWDIKKLTGSILKGNPLIVWVFIKRGNPTYWYTPRKDKIYAVPDEHSAVVTGFVGTPTNPSQIIVNDPLIGEIYWDRDIFSKKWDVFGRSGVVVY